MKILVLSPYGMAGIVHSAITANRDQIIPYSTEINLAIVSQYRPDWLISYGYRKMIPADVLDFVGRECTVNLHIGYLPFNRGAYPNLWSWFDRTQPGVTLHQIADALDAGPIWAQKPVEFPDAEAHTLTTSYWRLRVEMELLFEREWQRIRNGIVTPEPQSDPKSLHTKAQGDSLLKTLPEGWNTKVSLVQEIGDEARQSADFWNTAA